MVVKEFQFERLGVSNFSKFHQLFIEVFDSNKSELYLRKKYDTKYLGEEFSYLGYLALNQQGEAVSFVGVIPYEFVFRERKIIAGHSCDHMTRSDARNRGLFTLLNHKLDKLLESVNIRMIYGFPNQNNGPILFKSAGWKKLDQMKVFEWKTGVLPISSLLKRNRWSKAQYIKWSSRRINTILSDQPVHGNRQGISRSESFYGYKTFNSTYRVKLNSGRLWFRLDGAMLIGDMEVHGNYVSFLREVHDLARSLGVWKVVYCCSSRASICKELTTYQTPFDGNVVGYKGLGEEISFSDAIFTMGDYDTF